MQKITPFLWFDGQAEEAMKLYTSVFKNSRIVNIKYWDEGSPFPKDQVMSGVFELDGQTFYAIDAGPQFKFTEATSFFVSCETQEEIDHFWNKLTAGGGEESMCGWLKDKFGLSRQIVPPILSELFADKDRAKAGRAMQAMLKMRKIIISDLLKAANEYGLQKNNSLTISAGNIGAIAVNLVSLCGVQDDILFHHLLFYWQIIYLHRILPVPGKATWDVTNSYN